MASLLSYSLLSALILTVGWGAYFCLRPNLVDPGSRRKALMLITGAAAIAPIGLMALYSAIPASSQELSEGMIAVGRPIAELSNEADSYSAPEWLNGPSTATPP